MLLLCKLTVVANGKFTLLTTVSSLNILFIVTVVAFGKETLANVVNLLVIVVDAVLALPVEVVVNNLVKFACVFSIIVRYSTTSTLGQTKFISVPFKLGMPI